MEITGDELRAWQKYLVGKPCPIHRYIIKKGKWGLWCGRKDNLNRWCDGGFPTEEFINNLRKEKYG